MNKFTFLVFFYLKLEKNGKKSLQKFTLYLKYIQKSHNLLHFKSPKIGVYIAF